MSESLRKYVSECRSSGQRIVATNGCFDILHVGHLTLLSFARGQGDVLIVGLNSDSSVKKLKGESRPIFPQESRATMLRALRVVDFVEIFDGTNCSDFLREVKPDFYVKSSDYNLETLNGMEKSALEEADTKIVFCNFIPSLSTTGVISKL